MVDFRIRKKPINFLTESCRDFTTRIECKIKVRIILMTYRRITCLERGEIPNHKNPAIFYFNHTFKNQKTKPKKHPSSSLSTSCWFNREFQWIDFFYSCWAGVCITDKHSSIKNILVLSCKCKIILCMAYWVGLPVKCAYLLKWRSWCALKPSGKVKLFPKTSTTIMILKTVKLLKRFWL